MNKQILIMTTLILIAVLSACGPKTTQTPLEPATPTETPIQSTQTPVPTNTPQATSTALPPTDISTEAPAQGSVSPTMSCLSSTTAVINATGLNKSNKDWT